MEALAPAGPDQDAPDTTGTTPAPPARRLEIDAQLADRTSFAAEQNAVPVLRHLRLANPSDVAAGPLVLEIVADPPVFAPRRWHIDRIAANGEVLIRDCDLTLNAAYLQQLHEAVRATAVIRARVDRDDAPVLAERSFQVEVLACNQWGGGAAQPDLLAAFVLPNDPAISRILKRAGEALCAAALPEGLDGYLSGSKARAYELASAIWSAVASYRLTYAMPPASFEQQGQKVRTPSAVLESGLATCLDTTLLFAAALEQAGLFPVIVLTHGHAFAGVWLQPQPFAAMLVHEAVLLRKRADLDELTLFETTVVTGSTPASFKRAIEVGRDHVAEARDGDFVMAVDIRRSRLQRIRPLALIDATATAAAADPLADAPPGDVLEPAPPLGGFDLADPDPAPTTPEGRLERWQRKLLDLTTRNRLLNVTPGPNAIRLLCPDPATLEDRLAGGATCRIVAMPTLDGPSGRDNTLHTQRTREVFETTYAREALARDELVAPLSAERLDTQLTELYRKARSDMGEGGANTLFLAVGALSWKKTPNDVRAFRAPLILLPVQLVRGSVRSGVRLKAHEDEARFNLTLLQLLRQDFDLDIPELAGPLPTDGSGIDVSGIWTTMRRAIRSAPGFEVVEDVLLGAFSFAKYLMWKDLSDRSEALKQNPVVRHLLETPRAPFTGDGSARPPRPNDLDTDITPDAMYTPLSADSSQLAAVIASGRGCDFVLDGPPGTGKSQTIANMIAHNLALGRKVLFVSEKRAALEVVHRRLVQHGLGPFCLELHSNKTAKQEVLRQLGAAWDTRDTLPEEMWNRQAADLLAARNTLNRLVQALHAVHANGMTLYQAIGRVVRDGADRALRLGWPADLRHDAAQITALRDAARGLDLHRVPDLGAAADSFALIARCDWSPLWQSGLLDTAGALAAGARAAARARSEYLERLGVTLDGDARGLRALTGLSLALDGAAGLNLSFAFGPDAARVTSAVREALDVIAKIRTEREALSVPLDLSGVRAVPVAEVQALWAAAERKIWPFSKSAKAAVAKRLHPDGCADPAADLPRLERMQGLLARLDGLAADAGTVPGWAGADSDTARIGRALDAAGALHAAMADAAATAERLITLRGAMRRVCIDGNDLLAPDAALGRGAKAWRDAHAGFVAPWESFLRMAETPAPPDADDLLMRAQEWTTTLLAEAPRLNGWCAWRRARLRALDLNLGSLITGIDAGAIVPGEAADAFELAYARWWADTTVETEPAIRGFNLADQTDTVERFRDLDRQFAMLTAQYIRSRLSAAIPPKDGPSTSAGLNVLRHQLALKRGSMPVRRLIDALGPDLTTLAPCLLMSPLSVAQYLPAKSTLFDLVIFDEASQIAPWDAVGAIARGRQVVVAGDPKQMPPTSFFERGAGAQMDEDDVEEDQESILDECLSAQLRQLRLTWHYRSRHESLIAFCNYTYYGGELITFPAPVTRDSAVSFRRVIGSWARGAARTNAIEAKAIADEVVARLRDPGFVDQDGRPLTLAVITLNAEQQKLIEDLLDHARRNDPSLDAFFAEDLVEPVTVRNLETVQGDERDVVLLGIGYGPETPDAPTMAMNFGPLNRAGGWRRLNVAATRARREMVVFASFPPTHIDLNRTGAPAVRDLRHFLEYAERGPRALGEAVAGSAGGYESPFEEAVARGLRERGWTVVPQIGVSRFRIDLGVVHPDRPGDYLVGVECDGATYHSAATARDRDRVRAQVLRDLGWTLERVWSTHWWIDRRGALDRLAAALDGHLEAARQRAEPAPPRHSGIGAPSGGTQPKEPPRVADPAPPDRGDDYRVTLFDERAEGLGQTRFHDADYTPVLRRMVARVIAAEAPIRDDVLVERVARAHDIRRSGRLVRARVLDVARTEGHLEPEPDRGDVFVWSDAGAPRTWARARYPASEDNIRPLEEIALAELAAALRTCTSDDPATEAARRFGVRRLTSAARERLERAGAVYGLGAVGGIGAVGAVGDIGAVGAVGDIGADGAVGDIGADGADA